MNYCPSKYNNFLMINQIAIKLDRKFAETWLQIRKSFNVNKIDMRRNAKATIGNQ